MLKFRGLEVRWQCTRWTQFGLGFNLSFFLNKTFSRYQHSAMLDLNFLLWDAQVFFDWGQRPGLTRPGSK